MDEVVRYVTIFEKVGDRPGKPIAASSDPDVVSECAQNIADRAKGHPRPRLGLAPGGADDWQS